MEPDNNVDHTTEKAEQNSAAALIRAKLDTLYANEPSAKEERAEVEALPQKTLSKHQKYMKDLSSSGRSLAEIQVAWHEYYANLPDAEKHEVWQEFYSEHQRVRDAKHKKPVETNQATPAHPAPVSHNTAAIARKTKKKRTSIDTQTASDVKQHLLSQIQSREEVTKNPHVRSLIFGLSMGSLVVFVLLFSFFNERFITPFIRPSSNVSATPIIVDPSASGPVGPEPKIIIPKINVEAPVIYDIPTIEEGDVQKGLERGVVHYATTPNPGEKGNAVIFGHSSGNILNKGKYKFAFLLLKSLDKEDTFIIQKDGKRYVYKVYNKYITSPTDLSVLQPTDKVSSVTLITCDPPGTSTNRLIIQAEQIFPDPNANTASSVQQQATQQQPKQLAGNSESLWHRITGL